jgi:hypothetical protein
MIVYCDTSWLLSYLKEDDENHAVAHTAAGKLTGHDFVVCEAHLFSASGLPINRRYKHFRYR